LQILLVSDSEKLFKGKTDDLKETNIFSSRDLISDYKSFPELSPITIDFAAISNAGGTGSRN